MNDLSSSLRELVPHDPDAQERAWRLAHAAYVRRPAPARTRRRPIALVAVGVAVSLVLALTPAGGSVVQLVKRVTSAATPVAHRAVALRPPGGGRLLVLRGGAAYVIAGGAPPVRLGRAGEATFSAFGHYAATADGARLTVRALDGRRVWSLREAAAIDGVRWSPDGLRVAFLAGGRLRIVDGNGEDPQTLGPAREVAPAWRPGAEAVVAYLGAPRVVVLVDAGTHRELGRVRPPSGTTLLAWSHDGSRLLALGAGELRLYDARGTRVATRPAPAGATFAGAAFGPAGRRLAFVTRTPSGDALLVGGRRVALARRSGTPVWSPDGRWVAVAEPGRGSLFVPVGGGPPVSSAETVAGWCCTARG